MTAEEIDAVLTVLLTASLVWIAALISGGRR